MKAEILFLKELEKELKFLNPLDREDFMSNYRLQIHDRHKNGEEIINIISSFENPELIAKNIYEELDIDINKQKIKKYKTLGVTKIFLGLSTILPQIIVFIFLITFLIIGFALIPLSLFCLTMFWINFEPLQAIGGSLLSLGLLPLLSILFIYISKYIFIFQKLFFEISIELIVGREFVLSRKEIINNKRKNILLIILISIFTLFTIGGLIGSFAGDKTIGGAALSKNMINHQTTEINYELDTNNTLITIDYWNLKANSWYKIELVENPNLNNKLEIKRDYNFKKSINVNYELENQQDNRYNLNLDIPLNLQIFNLSSFIFTITYNPNEVKLS